MRRGRPFQPFQMFLGVSVVHLVLILLGLQVGASVTKPMLMAVLALAVVLVAFATDRARVLAAPRRTPVLVLLLAGIALSLGGDVLLGPSFLAGLGCFALAHVAYVAAFQLSRTRRAMPWWTLGYLALLVVVVVVLWPHLGDVRAAVLGYGVVLALTALTASRVNALTTAGGAAFLLSDALLALRIFLPGSRDGFPDPWQDATIMLLYCLGEGLIALGLVRALSARGAAAGATEADPAVVARA